MFGGLMNSNRFAVLAGSALLAGGLSISPAQAADLGGDCCADLEERVATLEATTARKGNRKVSLTISGWVNAGLMIWDDGVDSDAYVVSDNGSTLGTRITFAGNATINHDWSAGYNITIETQADDNFIGETLSNGNTQNQNNDDTANLGILYSFMWVKSQHLGTVSWGLQSQATDNISIVDLSGTLFSGNNVVFNGNTFLLRRANGSGTLITDANWGHALGCSTIGQDCHGVTTNTIKYQSPTFAGFTLAASWGENDFWDAALKYAGEFGAFKVAAAAGYSEWTNNDHFVTNITLIDNNVTDLESELFELGASIMHTPTGLFLSGSYSDHKFTDLNAGNRVAIADTDSWYLKGGIKQSWSPLGATAIYGEYAVYNDGLVGGLADIILNNAGVMATGLTDSKVERYGVGVHQWIDAAAMQLYAKWDRYELEASTNGVRHGLDGNKLDNVTVGGTIFF